MSDKLKIMQTPVKELSKKRRRFKDRDRRNIEQRHKPVLVNQFIELTIIVNSDADLSNIGSLLAAF